MELESVLLVFSPLVGGVVAAIFWAGYLASRVRTLETEVEHCKEFRRTSTGKLDELHARVAVCESEKE